MAQMAPAITAHNLCALHAERAIHIPRDSAREGVEKGGPATAGFELVCGFVQWCSAGGAGVYTAGRRMFVVDAGVGSFGAFFAEDSKLFCEDGG